MLGAKAQCQHGSDDAQNVFSNRMVGGRSALHFQ